jgi:hypothetical protein
MLFRAVGVIGAVEWDSAVTARAIAASGLTSRPRHLPTPRFDTPFRPHDNPPMKAATLDPVTPAAGGAVPDWLPGLMPPGYQTRFAEIQRLTAELEGMDRMGRLLWQGGTALQELVRDVFLALKLDAELHPGATPQLVVKLDSKRRLLLQVIAGDVALEKRHPELAAAFQILHQTAGDEDRVVLIVGPHRHLPPASRPDPLAADALTLVTRMGVNVVTTTTLFSLWNLSMQDQPRGRALAERLHSQDGGLFRLPATT